MMLLMIKRMLKELQETTDQDNRGMILSTRR